MATSMEKVARALAGHELAAERPTDHRGQFDGLFEGRVTRTGANGVRFTIAEFGRHAEFGPARHVQTDSAGVGDHGSHSHALSVPTAGTRVLVAFLGGDPDRPVILGRLQT